MITGHSAISRIHRSGLRRVWRLLPRGLRQDLFGRVTEWSIPAVAPSRVALPQPVTIVGALRAPTGLGQAARLALHALQHQGVTCHAIDLTAELLQPETEPPVAVSRPGKGPGTLLCYVTPPNASRALGFVPGEIRDEKLCVAGWVCETTRLPSVWRRQARHFHLLSAPTRFSAQIIASATGRPVRLLGHPVDAEPLPAPATRPAGPSRIVGAMLDVGSSAARKNVYGLAQALELLLRKRTDIEVRLKVRDLSSDSVALGLIEKLRATAPERVFATAADEDRIAAMRFIDDLDLLLSLSRTEGFGLPYAEAILRGIPVAAPRWGGAAELLTDDNSVALPYDLIPIDDPSGLYSSRAGLWADTPPDIASDIVLHALEYGPTRGASLPLPALATTRNFVDRLLSSTPVDIMPELR